MESYRDLQVMNTAFASCEREMRATSDVAEMQRVYAKCSEQIDRANRLWERHRSNFDPVLPASLTK